MVGAGTNPTAVTGEGASDLVGLDKDGTPPGVRISYSAFFVTRFPIKPRCLPCLPKRQ